MAAQLPSPVGPPVFLITGASSGIGEAAARLLAREPGASLVLVARREERLRALAALIGEERATWVATDLTHADAPARVHAHISEHHTRLDLLVNNAGASWRARFEDGGYENVHRTMELNFDAQVRLTEELLPLLRASAPSAIVNVCSTAGRVSRAGAGATAHLSSRWRAGLIPCGRRSAPTASTSDWCCRGSSPPRASPRPSCSRNH